MLATDFIFVKPGPGNASDDPSSRDYAALLSGVKEERKRAKQKGREKDTQFTGDSILQGNRSRDRAISLADVCETTALDFEKKSIRERTSDRSTIITERACACSRHASLLVKHLETRRRGSRVRGILVKDEREGDRYRARQIAPRSSRETNFQMGCCFSVKRPWKNECF